MTLRAGSESFRGVHAQGAVWAGNLVASLKVLSIVLMP